MDSADRTDVLIAGAGPVGLFLARECARRGMAWKLIEQGSSQSEHSKALAIFPRTLEIFDMAGVSAPFLEQANRVTEVAVIAHGRTLARLHFAAESPYSFVAMVPQNITEKLLLEELRRKGGEVEYGARFVSAVQHGDWIEATIERNGHHAEMAARFLVGCDGAHSAVRQSAGLTLEGGDYRDTYLLADVETNETVPANEMQLCPSELGPVAIFPMSARRRRIVATIAQPEGEAPSLELVRRIIAERAPLGLEARALNWSSYFHIHHRCAGRLRRERIFLAGDAAHIHSPFGGQGMNTGLQDAWNLAWKLDFVLRGYGEDSLLDTYEAERMPVIQGVIQTTDTMTRVMSTPSRFVQLLRDAFIPMVSRLAPFQHAMVQRLAELGIAYRGSPIVEGPGERYFDDSIRGGKGIGSRYLLLLGDSGGRPAEAARQLAEHFAAALEWRPAPRPGVTLVRPDGYIAYSAGRAGNSEIEALRSLLRKQVRGAERAGTTV